MDKKMQYEPPILIHFASSVRLACLGGSQAAKDSVCKTGLKQGSSTTAKCNTGSSAVNAKKRKACANGGYAYSTDSNACYAYGNSANAPSQACKNGE